MEIAFGILKWTPTEFWNATPNELWRGLDGWQLTQGRKRKDDKPKLDQAWNQRLKKEIAANQAAAKKRRLENGNG